MQRTGRKGTASFRVVVQDSRFSPDSGRVVARIGHYNPHTKDTSIDKEKVEKYLMNGAQPSDRVIKLLKAEKIKLPDWVEMPDDSKKSSIKNPEKLRKNQPKEEVQAEEPAAEEKATEEVVEENTEVAEEVITEEVAEKVVEAIEDKKMAKEIAEVVVEEAVIEKVEEAQEAANTEEPEAEKPADK